MVSAWAVNSRVVLGQRATAAKSNEITAIPESLDTRMLRRCIVTIDAMDCQKAIAEKIVERSGDYVLALKGNQRTLCEQVEEAFIDADARDYDGVRSDYFETVERGLGRSETRRYWTPGDLDVSFREDESRIRERQAAENFTVLRHIALARLKNEKTLKRGIKTKRLKAGWDEKYRAKLLFDIV